MSIFSVILFTKWIAKALFYRIFKTNTDANILSFKIRYSDISAIWNMNTFLSRLLSVVCLFGGFFCFVF